MRVRRGDGAVQPIAGELICGDLMKPLGGYLDPVDGRYKMSAYDVTVERHHTYVAGDFRVHNPSPRNPVTDNHTRIRSTIRSVRL